MSSASGFRSSFLMLRKAAAKKVFHKNTASRKISKLTRKVNTLA